MRIPKMHVGMQYTELVILHPVRSADHIMHFGVFGARNVDALVFMIR
jgi:hypothetical protein